MRGTTAVTLPACFRHSDLPLSLAFCFSLLSVYSTASTAVSLSAGRRRNTPIFQHSPSSDGLPRETKR
jgi:hypothetical protein